MKAYKLIEQIDDWKLFYRLENDECYIYHGPHYTWILATKDHGGIVSSYFRSLQDIMGPKIRDYTFTSSKIVCSATVRGRLCLEPVPPKLLFILNAVCSRLT